jgi:hypothetical protein
MTDLKKPEELLGELEKRGSLGFSPPLRSWDDMAKLLEMERLGIGYHYIRDEDRYRVARFSVPRVWSAEVHPFGRAVWRLAGAKAIGEEFRGVKTTDWTRAVVATHEDSAVLALEGDPVAEAIGALDLLDGSDFSLLDGTAYRVTLTTMSLTAAFEFSNPRHGPLLALEREILDLARTIAVRSRKPALISIWNEA